MYMLLIREQIYVICPKLPNICLGIPRRLFSLFVEHILSHIQSSKNRIKEPAQRTRLWQNKYLLMKKLVLIYVNLKTRGQLTFRCPFCTFILHIRPLLHTFHRYWFFFSFLLYAIFVFIVKLSLYSFCIELYYENRACVVSIEFVYVLCISGNRKCAGSYQFFFWKCLYIACRGERGTTAGTFFERKLAVQVFFKKQLDNDSGTWRGRYARICYWTWQAVCLSEIIYCTGWLCREPCYITIWRSV